MSFRLNAFVEIKEKEYYHFFIEKNRYSFVPMSVPYIYLDALFQVMLKLAKCL